MRNAQLGARAGGMGGTVAKVSALVQCRAHSPVRVHLRRSAPKKACAVKRCRLSAICGSLRSFRGPAGAISYTNGQPRGWIGCGLEAIGYAAFLIHPGLKPHESD
jgi:hypothetical protein